MTLLGENGKPEELDLSSTIPALVFIPTLGLLLMPDLEMIEVILEHDSLVVTPTFCFEGMALLNKTSEPKELDWSSTIPTLVLFLL